VTSPNGGAAGSDPSGAVAVDPAGSLGGPVIRVVIVDDHGVVREGLRHLLEAESDISVVGVAAEGEQVAELAVEEKADVVLMDLSMPGLGGVEATRRVASARPECAVLVLTSFSDRQRVAAALDAGAHGYLLKDADPADIVRGIRAAASGGAPLDPRVARTLLDQRSVRPAAPASGLSAREREVLALIGSGLSNRLVARRLGISEKTVKAHLTRIYQAIGVTDRVQAALWVREHGFDSDEA
jgi:DNA-binding NarL/FixJ family response regulator